MKAFLVFLIQLWLLSRSADGSTQQTELSPGFRSSEMAYIDNYGLFLLSNSSAFAFGFTRFGDNSTAYLLSVVHQGSTVVWSANRGEPVSNSDDFVFDKEGNAYLRSGDARIWSTDTHGKGVTRIKLLDSGNLVLLGDGGASDPIWQSFDHPTDTLLSDQRFAEGMSLESDPNDQGLKYQLRIESGDAKLFAQFQSPQPYWFLSSDPTRIQNMVGGSIHTAVLNSNSWNFYDGNQTLIWQIIVNSDSSENNTLAAVLDKSGFVLFSSLPSSGQPNSLSVRIPKDNCNAPEHCNPYFICSSGGSCQCPTVLSSSPSCDPGMASSCDKSASVDLVEVGDGVGYFATDFISPTLVSNLTGCRDACSNNCSCVALFHDGSSRNCFLFDQIGNFKQIQSNASGSTYIKLRSNADGGNGSNGQGSSANKTAIIVVIISILTVCVVGTLFYLALRIHRRRKKTPEGSSEEEEDNFLESISGMPVRFSYRELQEATENFSVKLGEGGFGSVYLGKLPDNTRVAVKKLEGIGQGKKEFRSEVTIIGSIHHIHLVKLRGFCAEGAHRLLAYEYMAKGSLDRWIFRRNEEELALDWDKRYSIALGTAKGLAYLHEDCESRIIHCDIKPENVLLDDNFLAKVSDFGLAKLMTREQSHVFTTLRGTRGYLAPEWITNYAISEKSDVYSYGMVLLEIIGGRKNFDPAESSEKAHFPSYAFKKMEEGKLMEVFDAKLRFADEGDARMDVAIKVALWCIQEDLHLRPSMVKVVQMLEGLQEVAQPPVSSQLGFRLYANAFKSISEEGTYSGSGPSDCNSDAFLSAVRLSGPR